MTLNPQQFGGEQLRMFMTAQELHDHDSIDVQQTPDSKFGGAWKTKNAMWATKRRENKQDGMDVSGGVRKPVSLVSGPHWSGEVIMDGHHRVQAAYDHDPQSLVPVSHHSSNEFYWLRDPSW